MIIDGVMMSQDEFRALVIRECMAAVANSTWAQARDTEFDSGFNQARLQAFCALEALLPKDRAKELVETYRNLDGRPWYLGDDFYADDMFRQIEDFARWLLTNNHVKEG